MSADDEDLLDIEHRGTVAHLTLNRAAKYNVLSAAMIACLKHALETLAADRVRVVVLGAGGKSPWRRCARCSWLAAN
jgi:enoyl-CoA hydratase/carnithine racemase